MHFTFLRCRSGDSFFDELFHYDRRGADDCGAHLTPGPPPHINDEPMHPRSASSKRIILFGAGALCFIAPPLRAQWLSYRTPGVPRTAVGKVDLAAPAPKAVDGKPDLSGVWESAPQYFYNLANDLKPDEVVMQPWAKALQAEREGRSTRTIRSLNACRPAYHESICRRRTRPIPSRLCRRQRWLSCFMRPPPTPRSAKYSLMAGACPRTRSRLAGVFHRPLGGRHAGCGHHRFQRPLVDGYY